MRAVLLLRALVAIFGSLYEYLRDKGATKEQCEQLAKSIDGLSQEMPEPALSLGPPAAGIFDNLNLDELPTFIDLLVALIESAKRLFGIGPVPAAQSKGGE